MSQTRMEIQRMRREKLVKQSFDLKIWTDVGIPFVAASTEVSEEFDVPETGRNLRIVEVP